MSPPHGSTFSADKPELGGRQRDKSRRQTPDPEPTRHPDRLAGPETMSPPLGRTPQREHARRGQWTRRLRRRTEIRLQRHRDLRPGSRASSGAVAHAFTTKTEARQDDDEPEGPPVRSVTHQQIRTATQQDSWLLQRTPPQPHPVRSRKDVADRPTDRGPLNDRVGPREASPVSPPEGHVPRAEPQRREPPTGETFAKTMSRSAASSSASRSQHHCPPRSRTGAR